MYETLEKNLQYFEMFKDSLSRYDYLIHIALTKAGNEKFLLHNDEYLIHGCQSKLWVKCSFENNRIKIECDSESLIILGFATIIIEVCNNRTAEEIVAFDFDVFKKFETDNGLLSGKSRNGLLGMMNRIKMFADCIINSRNAKF
ncbi:SufE family protein [Treponema sp. OMZ 840]|uniref:SufE family protein n=1 Tax=Treponema sp. OMZ 840 TaxID=244313 RepID=UPI003D8C8A4B